MTFPPKGWTVGHQLARSFGLNDSTGQGEHGEIDTRGPWNEGDTRQYVESPAFQEVRLNLPESPTIQAESSDPLAEAEPMEALLVDTLRDLLHAEKQLVKALPKMAKAARSTQLQRLFENHHGETEAQVERITECLGALGSPARAKPCKGMMGLVEGGQEVMDEGKEKDDAPADLALIGAAQRVEHYEIAGYTTAKSLAQQLHQSRIVQLLAKSLAEEENADQLLNQVGRSLMSAAKMRVPVE